MKTMKQRGALALGVWAALGWLGAQATAQQITRLDFPGANGLPQLTIQSEFGVTNQIQYTNRLSGSNWPVLATLVVTQSPYTYLDVRAPAASQGFYRVVNPSPTPPINPAAPTNMVWIPGGTFVMGSPTNEVERWEDEVQHTVTVSGFYMSRYEVTQGEYLAVVGSKPSVFPNNPRLPVEQVSWNDATNYCHLLNAREARVGSGWAYRLPTEAEWEYACRAGTTTPFHYGQNLLSGMANFFAFYDYIGGMGMSNNPSGICLWRTSPVGSYQPNGFGLYDMHGNVAEWCLDWYGMYPAGSVANPRGPASGSGRAIRGFGWDSYPVYCRSAVRGGIPPDTRCYTCGFRVVLAPGQP